VVAGMVILFWMGFKFGITRTLQLKNQLDNMENKLAEIQDAPARLHSIEARPEELNRLIGDVSVDKVSPYLVEKIGKYCKKHSLVFSNMPRKHIFKKEDFTVATYTIKVEGSFNKILPLLHELEHSTSVGKVRSVVFESEYVLREKRKILEGTFYIQSIMK